MLELGMLFPILVALFLAILQIVIYLQSSTATQYAAFMAARAYQVYGDRTLGNIDYEHLRESPYTNREQTIAEAAAEKVIFESLLWEHRNIKVGTGPESGEGFFLDRYYHDGNDLLRNGTNATQSQGTVRVNLVDGQGAEVIYCMPIVFPSIDRLFTSAKKEWECENNRLGKGYKGIAISKSAQFGPEPAG